MTEQDKQLLLKDLCARLPYGVKATTTSNGWNGIYTITGCVNDRIYLDCPVYDEDDDEWLVESIRPYLRPLSSMTDKEKEELKNIEEKYFGQALDKQIEEDLSSSHKVESRELEYFASSKIVDYLLRHHFDFRGLIPMGLALETKEGMYN